MWIWCARPASVAGVQYKDHDPAERQQDMMTRETGIIVLVCVRRLARVGGFPVEVWLVH